MLVLHEVLHLKLGAQLQLHLILACPAEASDLPAHLPLTGPPGCVPQAVTATANMQRPHCRGSTSSLLQQVAAEP